MTTLSQEQLEVVLSSVDRLAVIAGAGSGKTRTLVACALECARKFPSGRPLIFTLTNVAADEVNNRISESEDAVGIAPDRMPFAMTVHAYAYGLVNEYNYILGFKKNPTIPTEDEMFPLAKRLSNDAGLNLIDKLIKQAVRGFAADPGLFDDGNEIVVLERMLEARLKEMNCIRYCSIINYANRLLGDPDVMKIEKIVWSCFLVDEAQDIDGKLWVLMKRFLSLDGPERKYVAVFGDPNQAIYQFRGGDANAMIEFGEEPGSQIMYLSTNYRSAQRIVDLANALVADDCELKMKTDIPGGVVKRVEYAEPLVKQHFSTELPLAILVRTNREVDNWNRQLIQMGVPASKIQIKSKPKPPSPAVNAFRAYYKLSINPHDEIAFRTLAQFVSNSTGAVEKYITECRASGTAFGECEFYKSIDAFNLCPEETQVMSRIISEQGVNEYLFLASAGELDEVDVNQVTAVGEPIQPIFILSTIHSAKGLEWDSVLLDARGFFRSESPLDVLRMLYVAATRAKLELYYIAGEGTQAEELLSEAELDHK